jgi:hypothetical protein
MCAFGAFAFLQILLKFHENFARLWQTCANFRVFVITCCNSIVFYTSLNGDTVWSPCIIGVMLNFVGADKRGC